MDSATQDATTHSELLRLEKRPTEESLLTDDFLRQLINIGEVDILVGLPTFNNAATIGAVVQTIQSGILRWFPRERVAIINADGGSRDGTPEIITAVSIDDIRPAASFNSLRTLHSISTRYGNTPNNGVALKTFLAAADLLRARGCVVLSPDCSTIQGEWLWRMLRPVCREGFDLITPLYHRHPFDGLLLTNLLYPMTRALYGVKIREPYAADFAFSGNLGGQFLQQNPWEDGGNQGVDLRLTLAAIRNHARIGQAYLGTRQHVGRPASDLVPALRQTVGTLFSAMDADFATWSAVTGSESLPAPDQTSGPDAPDPIEPVRVNRKRLREMFATGVSELSSVFQDILSPSTLAQLREIATKPEPQFNYSSELWVRTLYEFAASYQKQIINRDHIIQALGPLFRGRACTFLTENRNASAAQVESNIEDLCRDFERLKPYLLEIWKSKH